MKNSSQKPTTRMRLPTGDLRDPSAPKVAVLMMKTRDQILPLYVPIGASIDLVSLDVVSARIPNLLVQDAPIFLIDPRPEAFDLTAQHPVINVLKLLAALILRSLIQLTL